MSRVCSKCAGSIHGSNRKGICMPCQTSQVCADGCGKTVSHRSTGRCRKCANAVFNGTPEKRAANSVGMKRLYADPVKKAARVELTRAAVAANMADPAYVDRLRQNGRTFGALNISATRSAEVRAKAGQSISATRLAHIPDAYRSLYRDLRRQNVSAPDAERMVAEQRAKDIADAPRVIERSMAAMRAKRDRQLAEAY